MTAEGGIQRAVEAIRLGAHDYLAKPFDLHELPLIFHRCRQIRNTHRLEEFRQTQEASSHEDLFFGSRQKEYKDQLDKIIRADERLHQDLPPILIEGETGTGKSSIARWIHYQGPRQHAPFIEVNCSALPESLAESELFGHERGAFTDAKSARIGLFEAADGGSLFLDEIPSLNPAIQAKVLTALESKKIRRVGASREIEVDVRIIAATNQKLPQLIEEGAFREDLYHRLNLLEVYMPPLRSRKADIPDLAQYILKSLSRKYRMPGLAISESGLQRLQGYPWPGNIRELIHELERAIILEDRPTLELNQIKPSRGTPADPDAPGPALDPDEWLNPAFSFPEEGFDLEGATLRLIQKALDQCGGNVSKAARILGVSRDFIRYRLKN
jgi:two-component system response regulator AtoC